jgi:hypothetical protein
MMLEIRVLVWDRHTHLSVLSYKQKQTDNDNTHVHDHTLAWAGI